MPRAPSENPALRETLRYALAFAVCCLSIHYSSSFFSLLISEPVEFRKTDENTYAASLSALQPGSYYISLGRPRAFCSILLNDTVISSNAPRTEGPRDLLLLGASFSIAEHNAESIKIRCSVRDGFRIRLTCDPVVARRSLGMALQLWRGFTQVFLGPAAAIALLLYSLFSLLTHYGLSRPQNWRPEPNSGVSPQIIATLIFATISCLYAFSLANFPRLFMSPVSATLLHTFLRSVFALAFFGLCSFYSRVAVPLLIAHFIQISAILPIHLINPSFTVPFYKASFLLFILSSASCAWILRSYSRTRSGFLMHNLAVSWSVLQPVDFAAAFIFEWENLTPSLLTILCFGLIYLSQYERLLYERVETATRHIVSKLEDNLGIQQFLAEVALFTGKATDFSRLSAYLDAHLCGLGDEQGKSFVRVVERGYRKDTSRDQVIVFDDQRGQIMREAIETESVVVDKGQTDHAWFTVVPLGRHACINISDDAPTRWSVVSERLEVLRRILPVLRPLEDRLVDYAARQGLALDRLRSKYGQANVEKTAGCIFMDIDDYSVHTEHYGKAFATFVSDTYLPAFIKRMAPWAAPETLKGDEVYLVVLDDLLPPGMTVEAGTFHTLAAAQSFARSEGRDLCARHGFPALTFKMGVNIGRVTLVCDAIKVRTAGQAVNEARRLLDGAQRAGVLAHAKAVPAELPEGWLAGPEFFVLQKKNLVPARYLTRAQADATEPGGAPPRVALLD